METQGLLDTQDWEWSVLDGSDVLDRVDGLDYEFVTIYDKCLGFTSLMLHTDEYKQTEKAFLDFANDVQGGDINSRDDLHEVLWAGYHPIPIIFSRLRWYGEDGKFHYTDSDEPSNSAALRNEITLAQEFHEWLPSDWVSVSETGGKGLFGKVLQTTAARYALDTEQSLTVDQIVVLSGLNRRSVLNAVSKSGESGLMVDENGLVSNYEATRWLSDRRSFQATITYRPKDESDEIDISDAESDDTTFEFVPVTDDDIAFLPDTRRAQGYQIGKYGEEEYETDYFTALKKLQGMNTPRFRRPNSAGNWGIKVAVAWRRVALNELQHAATQAG